MTHDDIGRRGLDETRKLKSLTLSIANRQVTAHPLTAKERIEHIETVFLWRSLRSLAVKNDEAEQLHRQSKFLDADLRR